MILASAPTLPELAATIAKQYRVTEDKIQIVLAPGHSDAWHVIKDRLPMSGLHISQKSGLYLFRVD